ncbi:MAG: hypothetical protein AAF573_16125, partial [Bacteroidota bacterium]
PRNTILLLLFVSTLLSCAKKFDELEKLDNIVADENIELFEVTDVTFVQKSAFVSDVVITFSSKFNDFSDALKSSADQIAVYKNGIFQFLIPSPFATSFTDENEMRGSNQCYQFAFAKNSISGQVIEISRRSSEVCFEVE